MDNSTTLYALSGFLGYVIIGTCCYATRECVRLYRSKQLKNTSKVFLFNSDNLATLELEYQQHQ